MGKKLSREATQLGKDFGSTTECCTTTPHHIARSVVLAIILLDCIEHSTSAERISQHVDKTTRSTRILKLCAALIVENLRHDNRHIAILLELFQKRRKPPLGRLDIGVQ